MPLNKEMVNWILSELDNRPVLQMNGQQSEQHAVASIMIKKELQAMFPDDPKPNLQAVPAEEPGESQVG